MDLETEIPIWYDGRMKWISNLTSRSTCEDIIEAIVNESSLRTHQNHSYVLYECWRGVERPLKAKCRLLKLWQSWAGECSNVTLSVRQRPLSMDEIVKTSTPTTNRSPIRTMTNDQVVNDTLNRSTLERRSKRNRDTERIEQVNRYVNIVLYQDKKLEKLKKDIRKADRNLKKLKAIETTDSSLQNEHISIPHRNSSSDDSDLSLSDISNVFSNLPTDSINEYTQLCRNVLRLHTELELQNRLILRLSTKIEHELQTPSIYTQPSTSSIQYSDISTLITNVNDTLEKSRSLFEQSEQFDKQIQTISANIKQKQKQAEELEQEYDLMNIEVKNQNSESEEQDEEDIITEPDSLEEMDKPQPKTKKIEHHRKLKRKIQQTTKTKTKDSLDYLNQHLNNLAAAQHKSNTKKEQTEVKSTGTVKSEIIEEWATKNDNTQERVSTLNDVEQEDASLSLLKQENEKRHPCENTVAVEQGSLLKTTSYLKCLNFHSFYVLHIVPSTQPTPIHRPTAIVEPSLSSTLTQQPVTNARSSSFINSVLNIFSDNNGRSSLRLNSSNKRLASSNTKLSQNENMSSSLLVTRPSSSSSQSIYQNVIQQQDEKHNLKKPHQHPPPTYRFFVTTDYGNSNNKRTINTSTQTQTPTTTRTNTNSNIQIIPFPVRNSNTLPLRCSSTMPWSQQPTTLNSYSVRTSTLITSPSSVKPQKIIYDIPARIEADESDTGISSLNSDEIQGNNHQLVTLV
ncbi:unnamed protein product [Didymodactylos carnosus]|uniref:Ras-associating domain-containing protein n=1 Tax=Didymodactylos carnosus TaxID=1234261 RepID=A0A814SDV2_9BILA|nr:unnamed protein product [Didymodactylos carnosus]CAF1144742.1 unnamed protein product [Didymodactylos carnosus]CAF3652110.1 unnamed protein product [Didymodactylos carnosus]CAF3908425.1 unnamed protein product [Didymodactylos carnosus]